MSWEMYDMYYTVQIPAVLGMVMFLCLLLPPSLFKLLLFSCFLMFLSTALMWSVFSSVSCVLILTLLLSTYLNQWLAAVPLKDRRALLSTFSMYQIATTGDSNATVLLPIEVLPLLKVGGVQAKAGQSMYVFCGEIGPIGQYVVLKLAFLYSR